MAKIRLLDLMNKYDMKAKDLPEIDICAKYDMVPFFSEEERLAYLKARGLKDCTVNSKLLQPTKLGDDPKLKAILEHLTD